jgi:serine protease
MPAAWPSMEEPCTENCGPVATLTNKAAVGGLNGAAGSSKLYSFEAVAGKQLSVITYGGTGNVSVYIAQGVSRAPATTTQVDPSRHVRNGAGEQARGRHLLHQGGGRSGIQRREHSRHGITSCRS